MSDSSVFSEDFKSPEVLEAEDEIQKYVCALFDTKKFSDFTFVVNGFEFRAHKGILSRIDYFNSMFSNSKEVKENKIRICDVEHDIFNIILEFIYKGRLINWNEKMKKHSDDLIKAANLYGIGGLLKSCEKYIIRAEKINVETACEYLILADEHKASQLKATATKFISKNLEEVKKTDGYMKLKRYNSSIVDVIETLSPPERPRLN